MYRIGNRSVTLDKNTVINSGGEAIIHRDPDHPRSRAVKILRDPDDQRARKLQWMVRNCKFPKEAMAPQELVTDEHGTIVGFTMPFLGRDFLKLAELCKPSVCTQHSVTTQYVAQLMLMGGNSLQGIQGQGVNIGDLNNGALMWNTKRPEIAWVDVDSWDTPQFPCVVGTPMYICPALYTVANFSHGSFFEPWHDWWSYCVLLVQSILRLHPFKAGTHPQFNSVPERAKRGITIFDSSVVYPPKGIKPEVLSDALLDAVIKHLKMTVKGPFPLKLLEEYLGKLMVCPSCGLWYPAERKHCPGCSEKTVVDMSKLLDLVLTTLLETHGHIHHVQVAGAKIYSLLEEGGHLFLAESNEQGTAKKTLVPVSRQGDMRFGIFADHLVISHDDDDETTCPLEVWGQSPQGLQLVTKTSTGVFSGKAPAFAVSKRFLYRIAGNMLIRAERFGPRDLLERHVCQILPGQCWFFCDPNPVEREALLGLNRDLGRYDWFVSVSDPKGVQYSNHPAKVAELQKGESLVEVDVRFDGDSALLIRKTMYRRNERVRLDLVSVSTGDVSFTDVVDLAAMPQWDRITGRAFMRGQVMHATDHGIVREKVNGHTLATLNGTDAVVAPDDSLLLVGSRILVVSDHKLTLISKK